MANGKQQMESERIRVGHGYSKTGRRSITIRYLLFTVHYLLMLLARPEFRGTMSDRRFGVPQRGSAGWVSEASQGPCRPALPVKT